MTYTLYSVVDGNFRPKSSNKNEAFWLKISYKAIQHPLRLAVQTCLTLQKKGKQNASLFIIIIN
jgi:hypothetical protein